MHMDQLLIIDTENSVEVLTNAEVGGYVEWYKDGKQILIKKEPLKTLLKKRRIFQKRLRDILEPRAQLQNNRKLHEQNEGFTHTGLNLEVEAEITTTS